MKLKVKPEDFRVEERLKLRIKRGGLFSVYRLEKRLWNTLDVVRQLEQKYGMRRISRAGLKDRYSCSVQYPVDSRPRSPAHHREELLSAAGRHGR
jgi:tRNA(Glu) U13 pseudouridine synthase TruD